ncbi:transposase [Microcoleus sp. FACHB-61]|nr:transposase [Microcoleus sp. FACHB-61]
MIWVDGGDSGDRLLKSVMDSLGWIIQVVVRSQQTQSFVLLKKRWVVERTFGWLNWYRELSKDDRRLPAFSQAMYTSP